MIAPVWTGRIHLDIVRIYSEIARLASDRPRRVEAGLTGSSYVDRIYSKKYKERKDMRGHDN